MAEWSKLLKKIRRKEAQFRASEPEMKVAFIDLEESAASLSESDCVSACEEIKYHFFIGNGGTRNGISRELLAAILGCADVLYMPESKDFSFASVKGQTKAAHLLKKCNGISVQDTSKIRGLSHLINPSLLQGPPLHLYLCLVDRIPSSIMKCNEKTDIPPGLVLIPEFMSKTEEKELLSFFTTLSEGKCGEPCMSSGAVDSVDNTLQDATECASVERSVAKLPTEADSRSIRPSSCTSPSCSSLTLSPASSTHLKHRSVRHYGYEFLYSTNTVDPDHPLPGGLPLICTPLLERLREQQLLEWLPDQLTVNDYQPGAGKWSSAFIVQFETKPGTNSLPLANRHPTSH